ncbi:MAG: retropepsin-like domain-containing protein [Treponema sp.]|jgi:hypothetical protein|nr:retropepsin-like domain-containing protein [Treponema sp.]
MALLNAFNFGLNINQPLPAGLVISPKIDHAQLCLTGMNISVIISTATVFQKPPNNEPLSSVLAMAHLDTGASVTSIDITLAKHIKLIPTGQSMSGTAAGPQSMPTFVIDLGFRNTLSPFTNLQIGSCKLGFDLQECLSNPNDPKNFGILIGRDVMSRWNIVWNGPTSTVFISD